MSTTIIGQEKLLAKINSYTYETLPKTMLFIGEKGCGKHHISKYIAGKFGFDTFEITDKIEADDLIEFTQKTIPTIYLIDIVNFSEKQQNQFLKFIEEPAASVYVILLADSEIGILPTILNRCIKFVFEEYSIEQLKSFTWLAQSSNEVFYKICRTPGKLNAIDSKSFENLAALCKIVVAKITASNYANTLGLSTKVNCGKDTYDRFDIDLFLDTLEYFALEDYKATNNQISLKIYKITSQFRQKKFGSVKADAFMYAYLTQLWKETRV